MREAQRTYVSQTPEFGKSFPLNLKWLEGEVWTKVQNPPRLRSRFYDFLFTFGSFVDGCEDDQMDVYPIGFSAYIRGRVESTNGGRLKASFFEVLRAMSAEVSPAHPGLDFVGKDCYNDWQDAFISTRGPYWKVAADMVNDPLLGHISEDDFERSTRENRECRVFISRALGECPALCEYAIVSNPLKTLHLVFRVVESLIRRHRSKRTCRVLECDGEPMDGSRVDENEGEDVRGRLYAGDVANVLRKESCDQILCCSRDIALSRHYRAHYLDRVRDSSFARMKRLASRHLARIHANLGGSDSDSVLRVALSDADRMPIGPSENDHNGAVHEAQVTSRWAWVVLGKGSRC